MEKDELLPARPGEKPIKKPIKGIPFAFYIEGQLVQVSKSEALGIMAQITNILLHLDQVEQEGEVSANNEG